MKRFSRWGGTLAALSTTLLITTAAALPAPWQQSDIGAVGVAGSAVENSGTWAIYGSGTDIWDNADGFHFAYQRLTGDIQIVARVTSVMQTSDWAKAGVMIREDLTAGSKHAFACLTPVNGPAFQYRVSPGAFSFNTNLPGNAAPCWVKLVRSGSQFTAFRSPDGTTWSQIGAAQTISMTADVYVGLAATSHDNSRLGSASISNVQITSTVAALPAPWQQSDIGAVGVAGSATENSGSWSLNGSGTDIWDNADGFHFAYQRLTGDVQIVARVTSVTQTSDWAKAGVMIREDLTAGSKHAFACLTPVNGPAFQYRSTPGSTSFNTNLPGNAAPYWVKLVRSGSLFTAFRSPDGITWSQIGAAQTIGMTADVYVGLAATSHDNSRLGSASISNVQITTTSPPVSGSVLFVAGSSMLTAADAVVKHRLEALGYSVGVKDAASVVTADASGKKLVIISSTITSTLVGTKFTNVDVPVLTWENALLGSLGMTGNAAGTDYGTTVNQTQASIYTSACDRAQMYTAAKGFADGCHDLAAGLYGTFALLNQSGTVSWGNPGASAIKVAYQVDNSTHALEFAYDKGAAMPGLASAPARRVFLYMSDLTGSTWTGRGQALFDNAVYWAMGTRYSVTKKVLLLAFDPVLATKGNILLSSYGAANWGWPSDPMVLAKDYLADITEASGGYVRWQVAKYPSIPDLMDRWSPITASVQFNSAGFTEMNYLDAYQHAINTGDWIGTQKLMPDSGNYHVDYNKVMDDFGVDAKINAGEVDEVVLWGFPFAGYWESSMGGRTSFWINGPQFFRNTPNFFVMGYNYERTVGLALHSFGHRVEQLVGEHAFGVPQTLPYNGCYWPDFSADCGSRQPTPQRNIFDRFSVVDGNLTDGAGVGAIHWAPNATAHSDEYLYDKGNLVYSMADDWLYNYPALAGPSTRRLVNNSEWVPMAQDAEPQRGFVKWYYQHLPRVQGRYVDPDNATNNGKLNNWWEYSVNFNLYPETQH